MRAKFGTYPASGNSVATGQLCNCSAMTFCLPAAKTGEAWPRIFATRCIIIAAASRLPVNPVAEQPPNWEAAASILHLVSSAMAPKKAQKAKKPNSAVGLQNRSPSEAPVPATGGTITSADSPEALSPEESDAMFFEWCKLLDDRDMTILDFFQSLHKATHPATRDPSQCTPEQQAWMDEQAAEVSLYSRDDGPTS